MFDRWLKKYPEKFLSLLVTGSCFALLSLNLSAVPITLPTVQKELGLDKGYLEWIVNAYLLTLTVLILPAGRLAEIFGFRRLFFWGLIFFSFGSLICGFSGTNGALIFGRVVQGVGGAVMFPSIGTYVISLFPSGQRGRAIGINVSVGSVCFVLGPILAGIITEYFNWRLVYLMNLPIALFALVATLKIVSPKEIERRGPFDFFGAGLLAVGLGGFTVFLMQGGTWGWDSFLSLMNLCCSSLSIALFFFVYRKLPRPIVDLNLFRHRYFTTGTFCGCLSQLIGMVTVFWSVYFQKKLGYSPTTTGALILLSYLPAFFAPLGGHIYDVKGAKIPVVWGFCSIALSLFVLGFFIDSINTAVLVITILALGVGKTLIMSPTYVVSMDEVQEDKQIDASTLSQALRQSAPTFGVAIFTALYFSISHSDEIAFKIINIFSSFLSLIGLAVAFFYLPSKGRIVKI